MSGASDFLDPVEAAQDEISRSKRVIASALDDLSQHHSWLETYHRDERRRAQRLRRQETLQALELKRQRVAWRIRRFAWASYLATRTTILFLARNGAAFIAWATPRAQALAILLAREFSAATAWSWRTGRALARRGYEGAAIGFAWTVRSSDVLGVAFRKRLSAESSRLYAEAATRAQPILHPAARRASAGWARTRLRARRLASTLQAQASEGWSRTRSRAPILARNAIAATSQRYARLAEKTVILHARARDQVSVAFERTRAQSQNAARAGFEAVSDAWSAARANTQHVARASLKTASETWAQAALRTRAIMERRAPQHRALIVRQCTALVCFEPRRARLPVVRES